MMIEMCEVINYKVVSKILNLLCSQNPHSFSPHFSLRSVQNHPISLQNHPQFSLHFTPSPHYLLSLSLKRQVLVYPFLSVGLGVAGGWWVAYGEPEQADGVLLEGDFVQQLLG